MKDEICITIPVAAMVDVFQKYIENEDVIHVVRCKDCKYHKDAPKTTDVWCERVDGLLPKDWFCADGEMRGEEE